MFFRVGIILCLCRRLDREHGRTLFSRSRLRLDGTSSNSTAAGNENYNRIIFRMLKWTVEWIHYGELTERARLLFCPNLALLNLSLHQFCFSETQPSLPCILCKLYHMSSVQYVRYHTMLHCRTTERTALFCYCSRRTRITCYELLPLELLRKSHVILLSFLRPSHSSSPPFVSPLYEFHPHFFSPSFPSQLTSLLFIHLIFSIHLILFPSVFPCLPCISHFLPLAPPPPSLSSSPKG